MDLCDLIKVTPVVLARKDSIPTSQSSSRSHSLSFVSSVKRNRNKNTCNCDTPELVLEANDTNCNDSINKKENQPIETKQSIKESTSDAEDTYSIKQFHQKTVQRIKMEQRKSIKSKRSMQEQAQFEQGRIHKEKQFVKLCIEKAQKRINERQTKMEEESDRVQDLINKERQNYIQKQNERERIKFEEQQKRARIYLLNYLYKTKYELLCNQQQQ
eukprot:148477_1